MVKHELHIVHLYPQDMNIYGDNGNVLVLKKRAEWRNVKTKISHIGIGQVVPRDTDILVAGGGQDTGQIKVQADLISKQHDIQLLADGEVPMLVVCGTYQLFGHRFITSTGEIIPGIGIFDIETTAGPERLIGNVIVESKHGRTVGYENHSGLTRLGPEQKPFAQVIKGAGNNGHDGTEGAMYKNVVGTYLHGPILPKNPKLADWMIQKALNRKYGNFELKPLDDADAEQASDIAARRPR